MRPIDVAIQRLLLTEDLDIYEGSVPDSEVVRIDDATQCSISEDNVAFLKRCGFAFWVGHGIFGVFDTKDARFPESFNFSAVEQTRRARELHRKDPYPYFNESVVLEADGMGGYFLLRSDHCVVWVSRDETWIETQLWISFAAYLEHQLSP